LVFFEEPYKTIVVDLLDVFGALDGAHLDVIFHGVKLDAFLSFGFEFFLKLVQFGSQGKDPVLAKKDGVALFG